MGNKYLFKYWLAPIFILWSYSGFSQCSQPAAWWMDKIIAIENSDDLPKTKIGKLKDLQLLRENCGEDADSVYARIVHRLGDLYRLTGDYGKGISYTRKAVTINRAKQPSSQKAYLTHSYFNLGLTYQQLNLFEESRLYYDSCIRIGMLYPEKKFIAMKAFVQKALSAYKTGDYQRSIEISDYGLLLARDLQDTESKAILLIQKAQSQLEMDQLPGAENNIQEAIRILSGNNNKSLEYLASSHSVYANLMKKKKEFHASINNYRKAYEFNLQQNNLAQCARDLSDLGLVYDKNFNVPSKAIACYTKSIQLLQQTKDVYQQAIVYNNMGIVYWRQQNFKKALYYYQKGLTILPIQFSDTLLQSNPSPAKIKLIGNDYILATLLANKGESLLALSKKALSEKKQKAAYLSYALNTFKAADKAIDQMRWQQNTVQSKLFWRGRTKKVYEDAIEACYLSQDMESAFFFFEKSRAVLLNDNLSELGAQKYLSQPDLIKEQELRIKLYTVQQKLISLDESTKQYQQVNQERFTAQESFEKFIKSLEKSYPTYYRYKYDTVIYTISDIRSNLLRRDQSFIEYFTGADHIYMLVIKPDGTTLSQIDNKDYRASIKELLRLCADKSLLNQNYPRFSQLATDFYERFFKPLSIRTKRVIISPDDHFVPFEILLTESANPTSFLLRKHAFSYTYSAGYLMKSKQDQSPVKHTLLGIAPIQYQSYLRQQPLPGADLSLDVIKSYFAHANFLVGEKATKKEFLRSLPLYSLVHLYSHAEADTIGKEPVMYLQDSTLKISELQLLGELPTKLIVLSACNTATGRNVRGEGVFSLARGFAAAGIPASITTLWQIDNKTTYQLTELFYKYLSQGLTSDEALREAKLEFLDIHDKTNELPYFWAASILIGKTESFPEEGPPDIYQFTGTLLLLFIILAFLFFRKKRSLKSVKET
jgi:CHAT domain-containing protein/tetratricopeptide (TPR) repeat protein